MQCVCISERRIKIELIRYLMYTFEKNEENKKEKEIDVTLVTYIYIYILEYYCGESREEHLVIETTVVIKFLF